MPGIAVLRGNLAPGGAIIKPAAASPAPAEAPRPAVVFDSIEDFHARIDDPDLDVDADTVLVLRGCGPKGYPGMPEVANMPLPKKLLEQGVRDMVRICDGRMSGTAYGTVILHVDTRGRRRRAARPASAPATGSASTCANRRLDVDVPADELRRAAPDDGDRARLRRTPAAAGSGSTSTTSCRPTPAPTSTSSSDRAARRSRRESH